MFREIKEEKLEELYRNYKERKMQKTRLNKLKPYIAKYREEREEKGIRESQVEVTKMMLEEIARRYYKGKEKEKGYLMREVKGMQEEMRCSNCGKVVLFYSTSKYCSNCGVKFIK